MNGRALWLERLPAWPLLCTLALTLVGLLFIGSATADDPRFGAQQGRQALFALCSAGLGAVLLCVPYALVLRTAWFWYGVATVALLGLPWFAPELNGSRRWYALPGFSIQPSEFAKLGVVLALAHWLRWKPRAKALHGLWLPALIAAVPAGLVLIEPDLGSSLVFAPIVVAMCYAAGSSRRSLAVAGLVAILVAAFGWFHLHDYQQERVLTWWQHWGWDEASLEQPEVRQLLRKAGYQPWQALIALGGGGLRGFGVGQGPQNRYDFLTYRSEDYVFAVVGEEIGWLGAALLLLLVLGLVFGLLGIAARTRERFGRLCCVGVATWIGAQSLLHVAVCSWLLPATGLPLPFVSYGGSSMLATSLGVALCVNIGARAEPVLGADGYT